MRVLVVHPGADCSVSDVHDGIVKGLRQNGVTTESYNANDRLYFFIHAHVPDSKGELKLAYGELEAVSLTSRDILSATFAWWPDVIIFISGFFIDPFVLKVLQHRPQHTVLWCTEAPYEDDKQLAVAPLFDTVILNDPLTLDKYRAVNPRTWYLPHSYDPKLHRPGRPHRDWTSDFFFSATGFPSRVEFLEKVDFDGVDVLLSGNWQMVEDSPINCWVRNPHDRKWMLNTETARCYRGAKVGANIYRKENSSGLEDGWAMGPREVEMAACGLPFLRERRGEGDELLPMLPTFDSPVEFGDKLRWLLAHPDERSDLAAQARQAISPRTFKATTAQLLRYLDGGRLASAA